VLKKWFKIQVDALMKAVLYIMFLFPCWISHI